MDLDFILQLILTFAGPYLSVGFIKTIIRKVASWFMGEAVDLSPGLKLGLGLSFSFIFFLLLKGGILAQSDLPKGLSAALLTLVAKGVYDLVHDLIEKYKKR